MFNYVIHSNRPLTIPPLQLILVLKSIGLFEICTNLQIAVQIISHILAYSSSCINPLLYAFLSENFRKAFRKVSAGEELFINNYVIYSFANR